MLVNPTDKKRVELSHIGLFFDDEKGNQVISLMEEPEGGLLGLSQKHQASHDAC